MEIYFVDSFHIHDFPWLGQPFYPWIIFPYTVPRNNIRELLKSFVCICSFIYKPLCYVLQPEIWQSAKRIMQTRFCLQVYSLKIKDTEGKRRIEKGKASSKWHPRKTTEQSCSSAICICMCIYIFKTLIRSYLVSTSSEGSAPTKPNPIPVVLELLSH